MFRSVEMGVLTIKLCEVGVSAKHETVGVVKLVNLLPPTLLLKVASKAAAWQGAPAS